jgi:hypothetical protein
LPVLKLLCVSMLATILCFHDYCVKPLGLGQKHL